MSFYDDASLIMFPSGYKEDKIYSLKPTDGSGDLTFTRASTATRVNSDGLIESVATGVPRIDFTGGGCGKLLLEPQRSNLVTYSEQIDNAVWSKSAVTITANDITSPDGYTNADKMVESATTSGHYILQSPTLTAAAYTFTIFAKAGERNWFLFRQHTLGLNASFNLATGTLGTIQSGLTATIEDYGNDWYRCSVTFTGTAAAHSFRLYVTTANNSTSSYLGDGTSGLYLYGAGCELGSYATSYIPTLASSVTRLADAAYKTGISSLIGQTEGTIYLDFELQTTNQDMVIMNIYDAATPANSVYFYVTGTNILQAFVDNSGTQATISSGVLAQGRYKAALVYKANDFAFYVNGSLIGVDTSGTVPTCNALRLENYAAVPTYQEKMAVNQALLFPTRLTNTQLASLTTI